ncbi:MAG TPA: hypothetical protein VGB15_13845 [Longimicrobium sp.]|jgi:hypothetical protein
MRTFIVPLALSAAVVLAAAPAGAQTGGGTDVGPPTISTAGGGSFLGPGLRTENEMFVGSGDDVSFRNAAIGCAVRTAERLFGDSLATAPRTASQLRVQALLGLVEGTPDPAAVASALAKGADPASPLGQASRALADALAGLMRDRCACVDDRAGYHEAPQWREAIRAFNHYVRTAPDSAFAPPAPELVAIHDALQTVMWRTLAPRRGR